MNLTADQLYALFPAVHRLRDAENGEVLKALLTVLAEQGEVVRADIDQLYDNLFIETCEEWMVPYLAELLGVRGVHQLQAVPGFSQRAYVANTLAYRRRKGTATMLEQLAQDLTGWGARAVEFFERMEWTTHVNHPRLHSPRTPDLRDANRLDLINSAFDTSARTPDVRSIERGRGLHNLPNVGLYLWRLQTYVTPRSEARLITSNSGRRYSFSPFGDDRPLFNHARGEDSITHLAEEVNVPGPLRRLPLHAELEALRTALAAGLPLPDPAWFGPDPVFTVELMDLTTGVFTTIPSHELLICDLSLPTTLIPDTKLYGVTPRPIRAAVDPELGRVQFAPGVSLTNQSVRVTAGFGFSGDVGGGPYDRRESVAKALDQLPRPPSWQLGVHPTETGPNIVQTLTQAVAAWNAQPPGTVGIIVLMDNATYAAPPGNNPFVIPDDSHLFIVAAGWPADSSSVRTPGQLDPVGHRAHVTGTLAVKSTALSTSSKPGSVIIDGLWFEGRPLLTTQAGRSFSRVRLAHSMIAEWYAFTPPLKLQPTLWSIDGAGPRAEVEIERCIVGPTLLASNLNIANVKVIESFFFVDRQVHPNMGAIDMRSTSLEVVGSTVLGAAFAKTLNASNSLFTLGVQTIDQQQGCVRFCYTAGSSLMGRAFHCQPQLATQDLPPADRPAVAARLRPNFTSISLSAPGFGQLTQSTAIEIRTGADDGSEMGAFGFLQQPQREANLRANLDDYLRFGLRAGLIYAT